jgi:hypothetical protein
MGLRPTPIKLLHLIPSVDLAAHLYSAACLLILLLFRVPLLALLLLRRSTCCSWRIPVLRAYPSTPDATLAPPPTPPDDADMRR